jgi:serine/threonine-protein kinase
MRWLGTATVAALVSGAVCLALHYFGVFPARAVEVPVLRGLSQAQARELLAARDLLLVLDGETPDPLPPGTVAQQRPLAGSQLLRGSTVYAQVAIPPPAPVVVTPPPPTVPPPAVAPPPPTPAPVAAPVAPNDPLANSPKSAPPTHAAPPANPRLAAVPSLVGKRMPQARDMVQRAGFTVGNVRMGNDNDVGPDRVLRQQPAGGSLAAPGSAIDLVVNESE